MICSLSAHESDSLVGRPYKSFDVTAFCSYGSFHPSQYLTDNNWDILCAFTVPGTTSRLDSLGVKFNKSQLRLLEVGGLLTSAKGVYSTVMPIFSKSETRSIRRETKAFADSIFPVIEPKIKELVEQFRETGFAPQAFSLIFSYLLDGCIWDDNRLIPPTEMTDHGTWSGAYWAMYENRPNMKTGTNGYGPLKVNWTDSLGYYPGDNSLLKFAKEIIKTNGRKIESPEVIEQMSGWGMVNKSGEIIIPVIHVNNKDRIDVLSNEISTELSNAVKRHCIPWAKSFNIGSQDEAEVIFYHDVMWDILDLCVDNGIIKMPAILEGKEVGKQHFADITFVVVDNSEK